MLTTSTDIASNFLRLREQIAGAAERAGRRPEEVGLVGVSKTQPAEAIVEAARAGVEHVGENRVQEAAPKLSQVREVLAPGSWPVFHMVGHLQTNKAGQAASVFDVVDSIDSFHLAEALNRRRAGMTPMPILLEVYVGEDPNRPGLRSDGLEDEVGRILELPNLRVVGLMTIAPLEGDARAAFSQVRGIRERLAQQFPRVHFGVLSMGMSDDYRLAIEEGSTQVRIGTALFGPRKPR
jgi:pyridoxal phosphate enzyme (YggS family)